MLLLFRSICLDSRCRVNQGCLIGNSVNVRLYRLSLFIGRVCVCPIPAHNEGVASERSCELYYVSILLNPIVDVHQRRSALWFCTLHKRRDVYPAMIRLYLQLEIRSVWTRYGTGLVSTFWISVEYILSWKENPSANWPCFNKALLSSLTELSNFCKCLCHS